MTASNPPIPHAWHRPDITGLRSLAIIPVVLFHAGISAIPGGFVGVDVFYAISGFLITTLLVRDASDARLHLGRFWTRRLRRLLPASAAMVAATLVAGLFVLSPLRWVNLGQEALSALFYVSNFRYAFQQTDYFAADVALPSPLIHTWSLGVEEQFYILWPIVILIVAALARKSKLGLRFHLVWVFLIIGAVSLYLSYILSVKQPNLAFYLLPTRAWEFALAGIAALVFPHLSLSRWLRNLSGFGGAALLFTSLFVINSGTVFPGLAALLPVVGTLLIILAGPRNSSERPSIPARILSLKPFVWIGDVSYSWYLWHWPFIVLIPLALGNNSLAVTIPAAALSLGVAALSFHFLENPIRFHPRLVKSMALTMVVALIAVVPVSAASAVTIWAGQNSGSPVVDGIKLDLNGARFPALVTACDRKTPLPSGTVICESGDLSSPVVMLLVGDSHASHWRAAMAKAAELEHVRLVFLRHAACPVVTIKVVATGGGKATDRGCGGFRHQTLSLIKELKPQSVVLSQSDAYANHIVAPDGTLLPASKQLAIWTASYTTLLDTLSPYVGRVSIILDNPRLPTDPNDCLARFGATLKGCAVPLANTLQNLAPFHNAVATLLEKRGITTLNTTNIVCKNGTCPVYDSGQLVWRDFNHLTRAWTLTQMRLLRPFVRAAIQPQ
jgi:peptidoglycan/LPS O-acetylase OafA/YrhL